MKEGEVEADLFAFLTTEPNAEVGSLHPKAMPVVLTEPEEIRAWMTAPAADALALQRPLPMARCGSWREGERWTATPEIKARTVSLRETVGGEAEVLIGRRTHRVPVCELRPLVMTSGAIRRS